MSRGGQCLSDVYINIDTKLDFICKEGHTWSTTPYNIKIETWCRECFYLERAGATQRLNLEEMHSVAKPRGWKYLSNEYKNARTKLLWECREGHRFGRSLGHVKEGKGCPYCKNG